jgi:hypothetical protein
MFRFPAAPQNEGAPVRNAWVAAKYLLGLALACSSSTRPALRAQELAGIQNPPTLYSSRTQRVQQNEGTRLPVTFHFSANSMLETGPSYISPQFTAASARFSKSVWTYYPNTIERMESAFYCNDTPFVDQVRLPLATFWNGRVKLTGFESDVTTANFVLGLPGQGALHNLSAFGNAFIATHTPPSDQLAGIHVTFSLHPTGTDAGENSGRRGIEYLVRASRGFLPFFSARSDSVFQTE